MEIQKRKKRDAAVSARIPYTLKKLLEKLVNLDTHINKSEFIRDAIREKVPREAPELYRQLFQQAG